MRLPVKALGLIAFLLNANGDLFAQDEKGMAQSLAKAFVGACVQIMPDLDRVETGAKVLGWKELTGDMAQMFAPAERNATWKGWLVQDAALVPFMLGIARGNESGKKISVCTVVNPYAPVGPVQTALTSILALKEPSRTETSAGQRTQMWLTSVRGEEAAVSIVDATPMNDPGVNLSVMLIQ